MTTHFHSTGIIVKDMARSLAFYRLLGLDIPAEADNQPHVDCELAPGVSLTWDTEDVIRSFDARWQPAARGGERTGLAFQCDSPADVDATYEALITAGGTGDLKPWDAAWNMRYATVLDPDGIGVSLLAPLSGE
jgi:catechol 2,3-dioxygenase-like lactoylglutathione lyase family enzyme